MPTITAYLVAAIVGSALVIAGFAAADARFAAEDRVHQERFASIRGIN